MNLNVHFLLFLTTISVASCSPQVTPIESTVDAQTLTSFPSTTTSTGNSYIGVIHPPLPGSVTTSPSWEAAIWSSQTQNWSIEAVRSESDLMLWLSKLLYNDQTGKAYSQVSDVVILPITAKDYNIVVSECLLDGYPDPDIIALVQLDEQSLAIRFLSNSNIILAWKVNQSAGKLKQIDTQGVECNAETFLSFPR